MRYLILIFLMAAGFSQAHAQKGFLSLDLNYSAGLPLGDFKNTIDEHSLRGWNAAVLYGVTDQAYVGLVTGFQDFYKKTDRMIYKTSDGSDLSAVLTHSIQTIPILLAGRYHFNNSSTIQPYAGLGLGANMVMYRQFLGEFGSSENKFKFAARPEAGVFIPFRNGYGAQVGAAYNYVPYKRNNIENLNSLSIYAGVKIPMRK